MLRKSILHVTGMIHREGLKIVLKPRINSHLNGTHTTRLISTLNDTVVTVCLSEPGRLPSSGGLLSGISRTVANFILNANIVAIPTD